MNVKNETARILRAHAERAASANALVKIYFKLYILNNMLITCESQMIILIYVLASVLIIVFACFRYMVEYKTIELTLALRY